VVHLLLYRSIFSKETDFADFRVIVLLLRLWGIESYCCQWLTTKIHTPSKRWSWNMVGWSLSRTPP